jgi:hypothetical protein
VIPKTQKSKRKYNGIVSFDNLLIYPPGGEIQETPTEWKFLLSDSSNGKDSRSSDYIFGSTDLLVMVLTNAQKTDNVHIVNAC